MDHLFKLIADIIETAIEGKDQKEWEEWQEWNKDESKEQEKVNNWKIKDCEDACSCLIHCSAGVSRSATFVIAFLMIKRKMNLKEAYDLVKSKRSQISPNKGFMIQLNNLEASLFDGKLSMDLNDFDSFKKSD